MENNNNGNYRQKEGERRLLWLEDRYATFNTEMGEVKNEVSSIKADVTWCKWYIKLTAGAALSSLVVGLVNLFK